MLKHYRNIDELYKKTDYHMHTTYTDGKNSMLEMFSQAVKNNLTAIAFTDHVRENSEYLTEYLSEIDILKKEASIKIYKGIEARIKNFTGDLGYPIKFKDDLDLIIASVHRFSINNKIFSPDNFSHEIATEIELCLTLAAIRRKGFHILGHCGGMSIHYFNSFPVQYFEEVIKECAYYNIAFEVNDRYHNLYKNELFNLLYKYNPLVTFGSDAHNVNAIKRG